MPAAQKASMNGSAPFTQQNAGARAELDELRVTCRRQAHVIDALSDAVTTFRTGTDALKAENADLRAKTDWLSSGRRGRLRDTASSENDELAEVRLRLDTQAPAAARAIVTATLRDRVPALVLHDVQLLTSELATNSVRHSGASSPEALVVRVQLSRTGVRLEVEDPGRAGVIASRPPDFAGSGGGFGLNLVNTLSERWGVERAAAGGTRVWAQIALEL
jgi:anti-sigma regulatory factor (Ser/Thr protein kinase)